MENVFSTSGEEIVDTDDAVTFLQKPFAKEAAEKPGAAGDEYTLSIRELCHDSPSCWLPRRIRA
jgi:hypothetical protein